MLKVYLLQRIPNDGDWQCNGYNVSDISYHKTVKQAQDKVERLNAAEVDNQFVFENNNEVSWKKSAKILPNRVWTSSVIEFYVKNKRKADCYTHKKKYRITEIRVEGKFIKLKKKKKSKTNRYLKPMSIQETIDKNAKNKPKKNKG